MRRTLRSARPFAPRTAVRFSKGRDLVAASLLALMAARTFAAPSPPIVSASGVDADRLPAEAGRVYRYVTTLLPGELRWRQIPWLLDLEEGARRARAENRPLLLFVSGDEPLGRC